MCVLSLSSFAEYEGSNFSEVWEVLLSDEYDAMPTTEVTAKNFVVEGVDILLNNAKRTIDKRDDLLPEFNKLLHPNGVCLKGKWNITEGTPYTGYYATGSEGLIIARASVALSDTTQGNNRGFGFAGKIYPATDQNDMNKYKTANFFVIDNLGGTKEKYYTNAAMVNEPDVSLRLRLLGLLLKAKKAFGGADSHPGTRQLYEISELGIDESIESVTPRWMMILGDVENINEEDFRDELDVDLYDGGLKFSIYTSDTNNIPNKKSSEDWNKIGFIIFDESVVSSSCDHRLHFHHAKWRDE